MIIDGKMVADAIQQELKEKISLSTARAPCLAVVIVGEHPPSRIYVKRKTEACENIGMRSLKKELSAEISESELLLEIDRLNVDPSVDAILVQLPLPAHINPNRITYHIDPKKDVDGFHPYNVGKMLIGELDGFLPCTPYGIKVLLERYGIDISGKHALVIGRSNIVGKPMAALLMQSTPGGNATVTVAHRLTTNLKTLSLLADLIIVAIGQPKFITADMVKEGAIIIDVGINKVADPSKKTGYAIVGDVDFENVAPKCAYITPVPGGVGPMTIAMLLNNTWHSYKKKFRIEQAS
ncbi:MAG: bifunctional 5,10-methylenetetrahydrofolate dehydrogenase/5,10-methenyltetrahydrofolate cyclohydrolase [Candidatus Protochlamydia sp.]|nr:bifunctional 5,10-methylenetetrahydrofolate dehydrogenase/5,10-methenyltetrahydrofolate cyclohydrolase [Candidatus Protochlamydia sp.]